MIEEPEVVTAISVPLEAAKKCGCEYRSRTTDASYISFARHGDIRI